MFTEDLGLGLFRLITARSDPAAETATSIDPQNVGWY